MATLETVYASTPATTRGKSFFLGGDPKGENFLYTCGNSVIIRNISNPKIADTYDEHQYAPTVARYAPSGYYICSADSVGGVRIWDTTQKEHILKAEYRVLGASVFDLAWSEDSKRIVSVVMVVKNMLMHFLWILVLQLVNFQVILNLLILSI